MEFKSCDFVLNSFEILIFEDKHTADASLPPGVQNRKNTENSDVTRSKSNTAIGGCGMALDLKQQTDLVVAYT